MRYVNTAPGIAVNDNCDRTTPPNPATDGADLRYRRPATNAPLLYTSARAYECTCIAFIAAVVGD